MPFSKVERCNVEPRSGYIVGEFIDTSESIDKKGGSYRVIYKLDTKFMKFATSSKSPYSKDNDRFRREIIKQIKIRIYIKKKDQSNNKIRIEKINQELLQQQRCIEVYNQEIEEVENSRKTTEALIDLHSTTLEHQKKQILDRKKYLEEELHRIKREHKEAIAKKAEQEKIKENAAAYLSQREGLMSSICNSISHNIVQADKFEKYCQDYKAIIEQGPDAISSLLETDCPALLGDPISQTIIEDTVIIPCGHTFSQRELLDWLKRKKTAQPVESL